MLKSSRLGEFDKKKKNLFSPYTVWFVAYHRCTRGLNPPQIHGKKIIALLSHENPRTNFPRADATSFLMISWWAVASPAPCAQEICKPYRSPIQPIL